MPRVYDSGIGLHATLDKVIKNGEWVWPPASSDQLVDIQSKLSLVIRKQEDEPRWLVSCKGVYSSAETWDFLRTKGVEVKWWKIIWFTSAIPRHSFMLWLACRNTLSTVERLLAWGYIGDTLCPFCRSCIEAREHLFFHCSFSQRIWKVMISRCDVVNPKVDWEEVVD